jgi:hypothetical protein
MLKSFLTPLIRPEASLPLSNPWPCGFARDRSDDRKK